MIPEEQKALEEAVAHFAQRLMYYKP